MDKVGNWANRLLIPFLFGLMLWLGFKHERPGGSATMIWSDAEGYYIYLPATLIYRNWHVWDGNDGLSMLSCCRVNDSGMVRTRYTYGVAAMQAPFFLAAHAWASAFHGPGSPPPADWLADYPDPNAYNLHHRKYSALRGQATGFSDIYGNGLWLATAFYTTLGLWFLRRSLLHVFGEVVASVTALLVFVATNLYYYTVHEAGMSHAYSFCLFAAFLWLLHLWAERPRLRLSLGLGACLALIFLIRPTNVLIAILIILWEVYTWKEMRLRLQSLVKLWPHLLAMAGIGLLFLVPQLMYWRYAFGEWLVWSYEGEGFSNALQPKILKVLFSYQNGLFLYTPIMFLAVAGMVIGWRRRKASGPAMLLVFLLATYVFASWWAWWFGGAFGHRCYVEFYALLALPLGMTVQGIWESKQAWLKWAGAAVLLGCVFMNLRMTALYSPPWDGDGWQWSSYTHVVKQALAFWR
jgi:hypothetical protein